MNAHSNFGLADSERIALLYILEHGEAHGYEIYRKSDLKTDKTTYVALKKLTEKSLLEKKPAEEKHPGQPMQKYFLTLNGLSVGLSILNEDGKKIEAITSKWEHLLPFVFKRWKLFKDHGLTEEAKKILKQNMEDYKERWRLGHKWVDEGARTRIEEKFVKDMDSLRAIEVKMRWLKVLYLDKDLRKRLEDYHKMQLAIYQALLEEQRSKVKIIAMLQETEPDWERIKKMATQRAAIYVRHA